MTPPAMPEEVSTPGTATHVGQVKRKTGHLVLQQPHPQGCSCPVLLSLSLAPGDGKMRDPENEVGSGG